MIARYLLHSDVSFDTGLCDLKDAGGATRPSHQVWKEPPSFR
jgi:hypothetical protein